MTRHVRMTRGGLRALALGVAAGVVVTAIPSAAFAAGPSFGVSASISKATADVGQSIAVSGKVSGPKAARKVIHVQRRVGSGAWVNVASARTTKSRAYRVSVKISTAGSQSFRVYAPKSKKARAGVSASRTLTGWRWIDPSTRGRLDDLSRKDVTIDSKTYRNVLATLPASTGYLGFATGGACDLMTFSVASEGTRDSRGGVQVWQRSAPHDFLTVGLSVANGGQAPVFSRWTLSRSVDAVFLMLDSDADEGTERAALVDPRVHCAVNSLPRYDVPVT